jgi:hypothetical protein
MSTQAVALDFSKAQPLDTGGVTLDFSKAQPIDKKASFGQRFLESSGLSGLAEMAKNTPQSMGDLFEGGAAPAKQAASAIAAPAKHLNDIVSAYKAGDKEAMMSGLSRFIDSFIPGTGNANELSQNTAKDLKEGNIEGVTGTVTGLAAQAALARSMMKGGGSGVLSRAAYTAEGELSPLAKSLLHPQTLPETLFRKLVPPPDTPTFPGASQPLAEDFYANKAKDLMTREAQQRTLDTRARVEIARTAREAAANAPEPAPFGGATSTSTISLQDLLKQQSALPAAGEGTTSATGTLPQGNATPFVSKFTPPEASKIVTPGSAAPPINKTLVSYPRTQLVEMAKKGDLDALRELIRNPGGIDVRSAVPNSRYLLEQNRPTSVYGGPQ